MDFTIKTDSEEDRLRKAFRTKVPGFHAKVEEKGKIYEVKDLSASGFAVGDPKKTLKEGDQTTVTFYLNKKVFLTGVASEVVRVLDHGIVGFNFLELERRQSMKLDKLVLEIQKRLIALRKQQD
ncbi:MAG: PilZ domain-containing protein [Proteobacteria bacterium]|nr:PilZ domain-containing protein [Pseudomonadota bacterium]MBU1611366.1 PilZ domain-containing protein [Pseudomonadota bacterium]